MSAFNARIRPPEIFGMPAKLVKGFIVFILSLTLGIIILMIFGWSGITVLMLLVALMIWSFKYAVAGVKNHADGLLIKAKKHSIKEENAVSVESICSV